MTDTTIDEGARSPARDDEPDPRQLWAWLGLAVRPYVGWLLVVLGVIALAVGYLGVSREVLVARQIPFFVSGGLLGIALVFLGGIALLIDDLRAANERLARAEATADDRLVRIEHAVEELRDVLLEHPDAPAPTVSGSAGDRLVALPGGTTYHRPGCRIVEDKDVDAVADPAASALSACKLCEPSPA